MMENCDREELAEQIKERGVITFHEYRLLTGACREGLKKGMLDCGLDPEVQEVKVEDVLQLSQGRFGGEVIQDLFSGYQAKEKEGVH